MDTRHIFKEAAVKEEFLDRFEELKQASEFGLAPAQFIATPITYLSDVNSAGLKIAHGLTFMQSWYWDLDEQTRAFAKRFQSRSRVSRRYCPPR